MQGFGPLFRMITGKVEALLADRGYDADAIRNEIALHGIQAVIPAKRGRNHPALHDRRKYRLQSRVEQLFSKLKNWRRIATRYANPARPTLASSASPQLSYGSPLSPWLRWRNQARAR